MYHVLLYYKIHRIAHPETVVKAHREICRALQLKGRILIGKDGINGTVAGTKEAIEMYKEYCNHTRPFKKIDWKESTSEDMPFPKLRVRVRKEIITTDDRENFDICRRGNHISRDTFHKWLVNNEDMVILDMRNDYEWEIGRFVNAVRPSMKYFRDLKDQMAFYEQYKGKKIVMFCTGGIRCEPASAMFLAHGFDPNNIFQLEGGIVKYAEKYGDEGYYEGKCFVFDDRVAIDVDTTENAKVLGNCYHCAAVCDEYTNCVNSGCNLLYISCADCIEKTENCCSKECQESIKDPAVRRTPRHKVGAHRNK